MPLESSSNLLNFNIFRALVPSENDQGCSVLRMRSGASCDSSMGNEQPWEGGRVNGPSRIQDRDLPGPRDCPPGRAVSPSAGIAAAGRRWPRAGPWSQSSSIPALSMVQSYEENISAWLLIALRLVISNKDCGQSLLDDIVLNLRTWETFLYCI